MIKRYRLSVLCALLLAAGAGRAMAQSEAKPVVIPDNAVQTAPGTYSLTDASGKKWIYRRTPFGVAKFEDRAPGDDAATRKIAEQIRAVEDGEFIRFERPSPFGTYRWKQKKTELGPLEQAAWDRARVQLPAARDKE